MASSGLEQTFLTTWRMLYGKEAEPTLEHPFHGTRKWRFDFAWLRQKVAVEIEGGIYKKGRHTSPAGFIGDCDKYNAATECGWALFRFTEKHLKNQPVQCCEMVRKFLDARSL